MSDQLESAASRWSRGPMPPHVELQEFLRPSERAELLAWAIANESKFEPGRVVASIEEGGSRLDVDRRNALRLREFGPLLPVLEKRLLGGLPEIMRGTGYRGEPPVSLEIELNAYGDGAHFKRHIDVPIGANRRSFCGKKAEDRVLSAVYYFYSEPKSFTGGALRLYRFGVESSAVGPDDVAVYQPRQNSLIAFPSWAAHEVEPVHCPTGSFADHRFALNCWFCRDLPD